MKLKILGKYGPYGKAGGGATSGYLITDGDFYLQLDLGSGTLGALLEEVDVRSLDGIFISHLHFDHTSDLLTLRYLLEKLGCRIKIYTEKIDSDWYKILFGHPLFDVINVDENTVLNIKGHKITFFRMSHPSPDLAIKIECENGVFAYTGDTSLNSNLTALLNGCDLAVVDCSQPPSFVGGHLPSTAARELLEKTDVKRIIASHADPSYDPSENFVGINAEFARQGKVYVIEK